MAWAISIAVYIVLFFLLTLALDGFLAFIIAVIATGCLFFFYLDRRAMGIECPSCGKYILTNTPWICGFCGAKNFRVDEYPFVGRCGNKECGAEPKAYQCHHCEKLIFLTPDRQNFNFAKSVNVPDKPGPVEVKKDKRAEVAARVQLKELMVREAGYDVELKNLRQNLEPPPKEKTSFEQLEEYYKGMMGNEDAAKKWHAAIDAEFPNDPVEREKRHRVVDQWMANRA